MALPNVGEIWKCKTTSQNDANEDEHRYEVVALADKVEDGGDTVTADYYAVVAMIGEGAGFRNRIRRSYMDNSAVWSIESSPIP